jgi:hypothetical protein
MAARWYSALTASPVTRWEAENPAHATVNNGVRLPTDAASGEGKVGYLNYPDSYVQFSLTVGRAGTYRMYVHGADGMGRTCGQRLTVNGAVRLARSVCSVEIDAIDLRAVPAGRW